MNAEVTRSSTEEVTAGYSSDSLSPPVLRLSRVLAARLQDSGPTPSPLSASHGSEEVSTGSAPTTDGRAPVLNQTPAGAGS